MTGYEDAFDRGVGAYRDGAPRLAPVADYTADGPGLTMDTAAVRAWYAGWDAANLSALVVQSDLTGAGREGIMAPMSTNPEPVDVDGYPVHEYTHPEVHHAPWLIVARHADDPSAWIVLNDNWGADGDYRGDYNNAGAAADAVAAEVAAPCDDWTTVAAYNLVTGDLLSVDVAAHAAAPLC